MQAEKLLARAKRRKVEARLQFGLDKVYGGNLAAYRQAAALAGCPDEQVEQFVRHGYVATPKALEFHAQARRADRPDGPIWIGTGGARGGGKSHQVLAQVGLDDCQRFPGLKVLFLRKVGKAARESLRDLRAAVLHSIPNVYKESFGQIHFPNGSRIIVGHFQTESDIDQYLGLEYDLIIIEEATTLTWEKFQMILGSLRSSKVGWRTRCYPTTNPGGVGHAWFKRVFIEPVRRGVQALTWFIQSTVRDNPFVNVEYRAYLESLTGWRRRAWLDGDWDIAAGQYFVTFRHETHVRKPFAIPEDWTVWLSLDYGFQHPTAIYLHAKSSDGHYYTVDEHWAQRMPVEQHAAAIRAMLERWQIAPGRIRKFPAGHDCFAKSDEGPTIAEKYKAQGFRLQRANVDRINGAAHLLDLLGDEEHHIPARWTIFDTCPRLIETIPLLEHDPARPEDVLKVDVDQDGRGGDDPYDSARYGLMAEGRKKMTSGNVDFYKKSAPNLQAPAPARSAAEVEELLDAYDGT